MKKHDYLVQLRDIVEANADRAVKQKAEVLSILHELYRIQEVDTNEPDNN